MSVRDYLEHNAGYRKPGPFDHPPAPAGDLIEPDATLMPENGLLVQEGSDAEDSIRRKLTEDERHRLGVIL